MTNDGRRWVLGGVAGFFSLVGLILASGAGTGGVYFGGLCLSGLSVLLIGYLVKRHYDEVQQP